MRVVEEGPGTAGRFAAVCATLAVKPLANLTSYGPAVPWPFGFVDFAARAAKPAPDTVRARIRLPHCDAQMIRASGVPLADGSGRVVLYLHGGAFLTCGANTHGKLVTTLSSFAYSPVLIVNYRMLPKHSVGTAIDDAYDAYQWLRRAGYRPHQVVLGGDSAGGYLALALAQRLLREGDKPAAVVAMSPLFELAAGPKLAHPNAESDAMLPPRALGFLLDLITEAAARNTSGGRPEDVYEPLDHIEPGLPATLIHVSGSEVLLHDAEVAAERLAAAGNPVEIHIWPGQIHVFQMFAPQVPEGTQSLRQIGDYIRAATPSS